MEQKKTVLIVEDEKNIVDIIRFNLQRTGYDTLEAYDGEAGLAMAREKKPDLILLDINMPEMNGFELLEEAAKKRGFLVSRGEYDIERMANTLLGEYHDGKLGRISLEKP